MIGALLICAVVGISDGDTLKARCDVNGTLTNLTVRLSEIDAPEKGQPFGHQSKQHLSDLCYRKRAEVRPASRDRYGRTAAQVICDGTDANAAMVRSGIAWAYTRYLTDPRVRAMEVIAQREHLGIWSQAGGVPPWEWRARGGRNALEPRAPGVF